MLRSVKPTFFATPAAFRSWLEINHATKTELLVGYHKTATGKPCMTWSQSVDEALCFGWIDGIRRSLGDEAYTIRFTPRKSTSFWSAINVAKIAELRKANKMRPEGEAAFAKRTEAKTYSYERASELSPAQAKQFAARAEAYAWFTSQAPSYQRQAIHWVASAKKEVTQEARLAQLIACSGKGERIPPMAAYRKGAKPKAKARPRSKRT